MVERRVARRRERAAVVLAVALALLAAGCAPSPALIEVRKTLPDGTAGPGEAVPNPPHWPDQDARFEWVIIPDRGEFEAQYLKDDKELNPQHPHSLADARRIVSYFVPAQAGRLCRIVTQQPLSPLDSYFMYALYHEASHCYCGFWHGNTGQRFGADRCDGGALMSARGGAAPEPKDGSSARR